MPPLSPVGADSPDLLMPNQAQPAQAVPGLDGQPQQPPGMQPVPKTGPGAAPDEDVRITARALSKDQQAEIARQITRSGEVQNLSGLDQVQKWVELWSDVRPEFRRLSTQDQYKIARESIEKNSPSFMERNIGWVPVVGSAIAAGLDRESVPALLQSALPEATQENPFARAYMTGITDLALLWTGNALAGKAVGPALRLMGFTDDAAGLAAHAVSTKTVAGEAQTALSAFKSAVQAGITENRRNIAARILGENIIFTAFEGALHKDFTPRFMANQFAFGLVFDLGFRGILSAPRFAAQRAMPHLGQEAPELVASARRIGHAYGKQFDLKPHRVADELEPFLRGEPVDDIVATRVRTLINRQPELFDGEFGVAMFRQLLPELDVEFRQRPGAEGTIVTYDDLSGSFPETKRVIDPKPDDLISQHQERVIRIRTVEGASEWQLNPYAPLKTNVQKLKIGSSVEDLGGPTAIPRVGRTALEQIVERDLEAFDHKLRLARSAEARTKKRFPAAKGAVTKALEEQRRASKGAGAPGAGRFEPPEVAPGAGRHPQLEPPGAGGRGVARGRASPGEEIAPSAGRHLPAGGFGSGQFADQTAQPAPTGGRHRFTQPSKKPDLSKLERASKEAVRLRDQKALATRLQEDIQRRQPSGADEARQQFFAAEQAARLAAETGQEFEAIVGAPGKTIVRPRQFQPGDTMNVGQGAAVVKAVGHPLGNVVDLPKGRRVIATPKEGPHGPLGPDVTLTWPDPPKARRNIPAPVEARLRSGNEIVIQGGRRFISKPVGERIDLIDAMTGERIGALSKEDLVESIRQGLFDVWASPYRKLPASELAERVGRTLVAARSGKGGEIPQAVVDGLTEIQRRAGRLGDVANTVTDQDRLVRALQQREGFAPPRKGGGTKLPDTNFVQVQAKAMNAVVEQVSDGFLARHQLPSGVEIVTHHRSLAEVDSMFRDLISQTLFEGRVHERVGKLLGNRPCR